jgi:protein gp37
MSNKSKIEWTDATWNPVTGCTKVSEGCRNCYAKTFAERFEGTLGHYFETGFNVTLRPNKLLEPIKWRKPKKIFVNSMSDVFHPDVPEWYIDQIFGVMLANHVLERQAEHSFQLLTKRPERMKEYLNTKPAELIKRWSESLDGVVIMDDADVCFSEYVNGFLDKTDFFPLPNLWLGVSVENQNAADERIPLLLETPAAIRFLSCEPLLGPVNISPYLWDMGSLDFEKNKVSTEDGLGWIIAGGESGHKARPMHPEWVRSLRDQCQAAGVSFHFKQHGEWLHRELVEDTRNDSPNSVKYFPELKGTFARVGKTVAGRMLDGRTWDEMPNHERGFEG